MKRKQIVERIAEQRHVPLHTAADWLDSFLHELIRELKGLPTKQTEVKEAPSSSTPSSQGTNKQ